MADCGAAEGLRICWSDGFAECHRVRAASHAMGFQRDRYRCIVPELPFGAHTTPMPDDADLSLPALATLIAEFLAESYDVPINAVFFRHFADGGHEYLAQILLEVDRMRDADGPFGVGAQQHHLNVRPVGEFALPLAVGLDGLPAVVKPLHVHQPALRAVVGKEEVNGLAPGHVSVPVITRRRGSGPPRPRTPKRAAVPPPADPAAGLYGKILATERSGLKPGCDSHNLVSSLTSSSRQRAALRTSRVVAASG